MLDILLGDAVHAPLPIDRLRAVTDLTWSLGRTHLPDLLRGFVAADAPSIVAATWESESEMDDNGQAYVNTQYFELVLADGTKFEIPAIDQGDDLESVMHRMEEVIEGDRWAAVAAAVEERDSEAYLDAIASMASTSRAALDQIIDSVHAIANIHPDIAPLSLRPIPCQPFTITTEEIA